jgi:hypothetical protein
MQVTTDAAMSPLILCDRLLSLAQDADRAGLRGAAEHLLELVGVVLESKPRRQRRAGSSLSCQPSDAASGYAGTCRELIAP